MSHEADTAAMKQFREAYNAAVNEGDLEGWLATLTDDCVIQMHGMPALGGKSAIRSWFQENYFGPYLIHLDWDFGELEFCGNRAFGLGWFKQTFSPKDGSEPFEAVGKFIDVFQKDAEGEWRLARMAFSADHK